MSASLRRERNAVGSSAPRCLVGLVGLMASRHFTNVLDGYGSLFRGGDYLVPIWGTIGPIWRVLSDANRRLLRDDELVE